MTMGDIREPSHLAALRRTAELTAVPSDTLDRLLSGKATEGDQLLAYNAIMVASAAEKESLSVGKPVAQVDGSDKCRTPLPDGQSAGLHRKFEVKRTDGSGSAGGKHECCEYFVLDLDHDKHALPALAAYAASADAEFPQLATDLRQRYNLGAQPREVSLERVAEEMVLVSRKDLEVAQGDLHMLKIAVESHNPWSELLVRVTDTERSLRLMLAAVPHGR